MTTWTVFFMGAWFFLSLSPVQNHCQENVSHMEMSSLRYETLPGPPAMANFDSANFHLSLFLSLTFRTGKEGRNLP